MLNAIKKNGLVLAIFACASTGLVAVTHYLTKDQIKQQEQAQLLSVLNQVIPHDLHDNELFSSCTLVQAEELGTEKAMPAYIAKINGEPSAIAIEAIAPDGYNGAIKVIVGMKIDGTILGTRVLSHQETPGLGDKIDLRVSDWILSFAGKQVTDSNLDRWKVRKDGGDFDQFTGATITPRAVVKSVKQAVQYVNQNNQALLAQPLNCGGE
ncbi:MULTISPECIES: electron transport complex subunit RsxG [Vibrio]|mgnify:FL=1|jgi:electron transport complex protein RnfG|uniref:Ion-translocating oxidoreductase complex subunit G n=1 Tax=Vibrio chagasii TaxID=170679 RepID=A0A7Y3YKM0_9VIBR|nr:MULTISPECIES: electron transport complex subunit RsxG [Vibrio]KZX63729.1 electron transport complex subunit RsxG [Vibrio sp. HI00D65]MCY9829180.1 electron transport complex subunit RsxG [Vibrio chagasii]MDL5026458.1 electron transport complex subunit RsxG [Vibrio sp. TMPB1044]MDN5206586.1 electron transport complex subunit RsxG [Vibrio sp. TMPB1044]MEC7306665.1 electron transport complex subunit RsxG [Vibrio crassostreae]|tara:strand:+ start:338 stop:967 length:630 start_codon:yes stop_codon:yes gene_type:complete